MDSGRNYKITRAILVMTAILMSVVIGSLGVSHNQNPSTETPPDEIAMLSKQPAANKDSQTAKQQQNISAGLSVPQPTAKRISSQPITHKSGAITQDETWSADNVYVADDTVTVPEGKTLTIGPGVIVKNGREHSVIAVEPGGKLVVTGSDTSPVVITSSKDDTVGGDTNDNGDSIAQKGDYETAISTQSGSNVTVRNIRVTYAQTAFSIGGGQIELLNTAVDAAETGLVASSGTVIFNGTMTNIVGKGIQACGWDVPDCSVRVLSSEAQASTAGLVCGQVTTLLQALDSSIIGEVSRASNCEDAPQLLGQLGLAQ